MDVEEALLMFLLEELLIASHWGRWFMSIFIALTPLF